MCKEQRNRIKNSLQLLCVMSTILESPASGSANPGEDNDDGVSDDPSDVDGYGAMELLARVVSRSV